jgi:hypothetical protein
MVHDTKAFEMSILRSSLLCLICTLKVKSKKFVEEYFLT